jgi:thiamine-phosphate pyrophosphorylase
MTIAVVAGVPSFFDVVQLRDKDASSGARLARADSAVALAHRAGARLILNDRADLARLSGADGVHVGQDDLPVEEARRIVGPDALIGLSTHDEAQIAAALLTSADYIAVGPIYVTASKDTGYSARGLDLLRHALRLRSGQADHTDHTDSHLLSALTAAC